MPTWLEKLKITLLCLGLLPLAWLFMGIWGNWLGANPAETIIRETGGWALKLLLLTLSITPLRRLTHWHWLLKLRRLTGLYAFFYATAHLLCYLWLEQFFDAAEILADIMERPFITVGVFSYILMIPLAATSTDAMIKRLGGQNWQRLHRFVYLIALCGVLHFWWLVKIDTREPLVYAVILGGLLGFRVFDAMQKKNFRENK